MKPATCKFIGIALIGVDLLAAIAYQVFGTGLVTTSPPGLPHFGMTSQGFAVTIREDSRVVFHLANLLSLACIASLAIFYLVRSRRHETNA
jgi:hypothetical protein